MTRAGLPFDHRNRSKGQGGPFVPDELRHLLAHPADGKRFDDLWPYLCSEGTAWPAAYAAAPYFVTIARSEGGGTIAQSVVIQQQNPNTGVWVTVAQGTGSAAYACQGHSPSKRYRMGNTSQGVLFPCA